MDASDHGPGRAAASGASAAAAAGPDAAEPSAASGAAAPEAAAPEAAAPEAVAPEAVAAGDAGPDGWVEQRRQAIAGHAAALEAGRAAEAREAAELIAGFVREASERGLSPEVLSARSFDGRSTYRTRIRGWYLKSNRSVAVGDDGGYYVLTVPSSLRARFTGADLQPSTPRLVVGAGGGDGETIPLAQLLRRRLDLGVSWP